MAAGRACEAQRRACDQSSIDGSGTEREEGGGPTGALHQLGQRCAQKTEESADSRLPQQKAAFQPVQVAPLVPVTRHSRGASVPR